MRVHCPQNNRRRGLATVELAVCLPVVVLLVLATIESCSMVFLKQSLTVAAYEGVRTAITEGATAGDITATCTQILQDRHVENAKITVRPPNVAALAPGQYVDVTVTAPCDANSILPDMFYRGRNLSASASMMIEL